MLPEEFYWRQPDVVALDLLGKVVVRRAGAELTVSCRLVEVEAYFGECDPASRASWGPKGRIARSLRGPAGRLLVYPVHTRWMVNVVAHEPGMAGAVLFRSCIPLGGVEVMTVNRGLGGLRGGVPWRRLTYGPGRLSEALGIDGSLDGVPVFVEGSPVALVDDGYRPRRVERTGRVGVREDLELPLRFVDPDAMKVSRPT